MWNMTKNKIKENALPMTLEVIKSVATNLINDQIKKMFPQVNFIVMLLYFPYSIKLIQHL